MNLGYTFGLFILFGGILPLFNHLDDLDNLKPMNSGYKTTCPKDMVLAPTSSRVTASSKQSPLCVPQPLR